MVFGGAASIAEKLIAGVRDMFVEVGLPYVIENVMGASKHMSDAALVVRGQEFGLAVERPRILESGGGLSLSASDFLSEGGCRLRGRCCLGGHARYDRLDYFGRRVRVPCCRGNTFAVMGGAPRRSTVEQCASAMGLDAGHMGFDRMAKAIPPAYASFAFGQMVRYVLRARYGLTVPSFDEARRDWPGARRQMQFWRRGAGGTSPALGLWASSQLLDPRGLRCSPSAVVRSLRLREAPDAAEGGQTQALMRLYLPREPLPVVSIGSRASLRKWPFVRLICRTPATSTRRVARALPALG